MKVTHSEPASSAAGLMMIALGANVLLLVFFLVLNRVVPDTHEGAWPIIQEVFWLGASGLLVFGLLQLSGAVDEPTLLRVTAGAMVLTMLIDLAMTALQAKGRGTGFTLVYDASSLVSLVTRLLLIVCIIQLTMKTHAWVLPVLGTVAMMSLLRSGLSLASNHQLVGIEVYRSEVYRYASPVVSVFNLVGLFVGAIALKSAVSALPNTPALMAAAGLVPAPPQPVAPIADFLVGGILLAVGIGVTMVSMAAASEGGRYVVATGAIVVGVVRIIRGFVRLGRSEA